MSHHDSVKLRFFLPVIVFTCVAGMVIGGTLGFIGGAADNNMVTLNRPTAYSGGEISPASLGGLAGLVSGLLVAVGWCGCMIAGSRRLPGGRMVARGALFGLAAGVAASFILLGGLIAVGLPDSVCYPSPTYRPLLAGGAFLCGVVFGPVIGAMGGRYCKQSLSLACPSVET